MVVFRADDGFSVFGTFREDLDLSFVVVLWEGVTLSFRGADGFTVLVVLREEDDFSVVE